MRKYIRQITLLVLTVPLMFGMTSCSDDDGYSLDKYWRSMVTINKVGDNTYDFTLDSGEKLWIAAPVGLNLKPKYKRAIIDYTILSDAQNGYDHYIKLNRFYDILTKSAIYIDPNNSHKQDSIGNHPIKVHSVWEGGDYLNIHFGFNAGGEKSHMINLVSTQQDLSVNESLVKLEFRHNQAGDPEHYPSNGYVSFDLSPYKIAGREKVTFELSWKDFGGKTKTYNIEYKYKNSGASKSMTLDENDYTNLNIY